MVVGGIAPTSGARLRTVLPAGMVGLRERDLAVSLQLCSEAFCKFTDVYAFVVREGYIAGLALC